MKVKLLIFLVFFFYLWTASQGRFNFNFTSQNYGGSAYHDLMDAFLSGKLELLIKPREELLSLPDPYDPTLNAPYRLHDASLYKGKYYFYYGPASVILLYIPFKLLTKTYIPDNLVIALFGFGSFVWAVALLFHLRKKYFQEVPEWMLLLSIAVLGFSNGIPYLLRRPEMYEVAISSGVFFISASVYWLCRGITTPNLNLKFLTLGSLFLGISIAARPIFILSFILLILIFIKKLKENQALLSQSKTILAISLFMPFTIIVSLVLLYNYLRFDDPIEFGTKYILPAYHVKFANSLNIFNKVENIFTNFYFYFFHLPKINSDFPFVHTAPIPSFIITPNFYLYELMVGIFPLIPFLLLVFICPIIYCKENNIIYKELFKLETLFKFPELLIIIIPPISGILVLLTYFGITMRYVADYGLLLILSASIIWLYFDYKLKKSEKTRKLINKFAIFLSVISILFGMAFSITGCCGGLKYQNPEQFNELKNLFNPISEIIFLMSPSWESKWERIRIKTKAIPFSIEASSTYSNSYHLRNITDGNTESSWIARDGNPAILTINPLQPSIAKSIWLLSFQTTLMECWKRLKVNFYFQGKLSSTQEFSFLNAHKERIQHATFLPTLADKIELYFWDPVIVNLSGKYVDPISVHPGYAEILIEGV